MKVRHSACPSLEQLEDRRVPASVMNVAGNLILSLAPGETAFALSVKQSTANKFLVTDHAVSQGTLGPVSKLTILGGNGNDSVTVDVNGLAYTGSVTVSEGNGNDTLSFVNTNLAAGSIGGSVSVVSGTGNSTYNLNTTGVVGTGHVLTFGGAVGIVDLGGTTDLANVGNSTAITHFSSNLSITGINNVLLTNGQNDTFGGNIVLSIGTHGGNLHVEQGVIGGSEVDEVAGSVTITGGANSAAVFLRGMNIHGNLVANMGAGLGPDPVFGTPGNEFAVSSSAASVTKVFGTFSYTGGFGGSGDFVDLRGGDFLSSVVLTLEGSTEGVALASFGAPTIIGGGLRIVGGDGNFTITGDGMSDGGNTAKITGNVTIILGNGTNLCSFDAGSSIGGTLFWRSGSGKNTLTLGAAQTYLLDVAFGGVGSTNTFNVLAGATLTGFLQGFGGSNTFNNAGTIGSPFLDINF